MQQSNLFIKCSSSCLNVSPDKDTTKKWKIPYFNLRIHWEESFLGRFHYFILLFILYTFSNQSCFKTSSAKSSTSDESTVKHVLQHFPHNSSLFVLRSSLKMRTFVPLLPQKALCKGANVGSDDIYDKAFTYALVLTPWNLDNFKYVCQKQSNGECPFGVYAVQPRLYACASVASFMDV